MSTDTNDTRLVAIGFGIIGAFVLFLVFSMSFGMMGFGPMTGGMWGSGHMWDGHMWGDGTVSGWVVLVGLVMQLLFLLAIVGAGYLIYRALTTADDGHTGALEELRFAYARGDLTDEEYEQRKDTLERDT